MLKVFLAILALASSAYSQCQPSVTTASGTKAPAQICSGALIFEDNFNDFDLKTWQHEVNMAGGHNWEFQWYVNNRSNSYTLDGKLFITPTLTETVMSEPALRGAYMNIHGGTPADQCTDAGAWGCERQGTPEFIIPPIRSARIRTVNSFNFKYGRVEVRAKLPAGDWLWPAIWLMPTTHAYGTWPNSGEIDLMEGRGNRDLTINGGHIGVNQVGQTLHFGPYATFNGFLETVSHYNIQTGFHNDFHLFQMEWTPNEISFSVDGNLVNVVRGPFWDLGRFEQLRPGTDNPWWKTTSNYAMAPFDQEFYFIINNAVGGTNFFPDEAQNPGGKPWWNTSPTAAADFWNGRGQWLSTWNLGENMGHGASLQVDYVRVWAL